MNKKYLFSFFFFSVIMTTSWMVNAQMITGVWKGKINRQKVEIRIIQKGDSLTGTSYYYESTARYRRYSLKGYFDANTNEAVWWDDRLIEEKPAHAVVTSGKVALLTRADFNCPGDGRMMLEGKAGQPEEDPRADVHLNKTGEGYFSDEWDFVLDNYLSGANDPQIIDSIGRLAYQPYPEPVLQDRPIFNEPVSLSPAPAGNEIATAIIPKKERTGLPPTIEEKFISRKKILVTEIPVSGDSIELRFYDNAEIDGDSISLFLNNRLIFRHIRLLASAYTIRLAVKELDENSELTMVAENLGAIPPNTSYMVALVGEKRYEARLESTEGSSAMIRFRKAKPTLSP